MGTFCQPSMIPKLLNLTKWNFHQRIFRPLAILQHMFWSRETSRRNDVMIINIPKMTQFSQKYLKWQLKISKKNSKNSKKNIKKTIIYGSFVTWYISIIIRKYTYRVRTKGPCPKIGVIFTKKEMSSKTIENLRKSSKTSSS